MQNLEVINNATDVFRHAHLGARGYWEELVREESGARLSHPGFFFLASETENRVRSCPSSIGRDNRDVYGKELGLNDAELQVLKEAGVI